MAVFILSVQTEDIPEDLAVCDVLLFKDGLCNFTGKTGKVV